MAAALADPRVRAPHLHARSAGRRAGSAHRRGDQNPAPRGRPGFRARWLRSRPSRRPRRDCWWRRPGPGAGCGRAGPVPPVRGAARYRAWCPTRRCRCRRDSGSRPRSSPHRGPSRPGRWRDRPRPMPIRGRGAGNSMGRASSLTRPRTCTHPHTPSPASRVSPTVTRQSTHPTTAGAKSSHATTSSRRLQATGSNRARRHRSAPDPAA